MLINCPRCGFSQPQDQYCAQCGVDMQNFKPKEVPLLTQFLKSAFFQVSLLLVTAFLIGQYLLSRPAPQKFVQRILRSQGVTTSESSKQINDNDEAEELTNSDSIQIAKNTSEPQKETGTLTELSHDSANNSDATINSTANSFAKSGTEINNSNLKLTYAEVSTEVINKWIGESSSAGLYQSLPDYAVGILTEFHKRSDKFQILKSADLKIIAGSSNTNLSGLMSDDGTQLIGLTTAIDLKSTENETLAGSISVTKSSRQGHENFPSEFEMPKGSAFFIIGTLKIENFLAERAKLQMPPFQIFKSPDFMTRKTEFVIIIEPVYK